MSEARWLETHFVSWLLKFLPDEPEPSERKLKLFGVACCRRASEWVSFASHSDVIDACERSADDPSELRRVGEFARLAELAAVPPDYGEDPDDLFWFARAVSTLVNSGTSVEVIADSCRDPLCGHDDFEAGHGEALFQADLFREIFGNPFRPVALEPSWRTSTAIALAETIYADRAFDRLPILADALEDAGCDAAELLAHLRGPGPHVRGCWALDLVLGKV